LAGNLGSLGLLEERIQLSLGNVQLRLFLVDLRRPWLELLLLDLDLVVELLGLVCAKMSDVNSALLSQMVITFQTVGDLLQDSLLLAQLTLKLLDLRTLLLDLRGARFDVPLSFLLGLGIL
jgi:hypothetical protein